MNRRDGDFMTEIKGVDVLVIGLGGAGHPSSKGSAFSEEISR
jgi:hypothetical protein